MTHALSLRSLAVVLALGAFATPAAAKMPDPARSVVPPVLLVVERDDSGTPDPLGEFRVVVNDVAGVPKPDVLVSLDFGGCSDTRLSMD